MPLCRLIYISEPQFDPARGTIVSQLGAILSASRRNNQAAGITGALAYDEASFLQVLEGERAAIWRTFNRINEDDRHGQCVLVEMIEVARRIFGNWWMGLAVRDHRTAGIFAPYLVNGALRADTMRARDVIDLMKALASYGMDRKVLDLAA